MGAPQSAVAVGKGTGDHEHSTRRFDPVRWTGTGAFRAMPRGNRTATAWRSGRLGLRSLRLDVAIPVDALALT